MVLLLVLGLGAGRAQEEEAAEGDAPAEGEAPAEECKECEEAWEYVEFLKVEVNEKVTEMLQDFKSSGGAEQTVTQTMEQVQRGFDGT